MLRLPREIRPLFGEWLQNHYPERQRKVMNVLDAHHQNPEGRTQWSVRMRGTGVLADLLSQRFAIASRKAGFDHEQAPLRTDLFRPPRSGAEAGQMGLFD